MTILGRSTLRHLLQKRETYCVSLYMPAHRAGPAIRQDPIRLKNLSRTAEAQLVELGMGAANMREFLSPLRVLLEDSAFWRHQSDGLCIFLSPGEFHHYRVLLPFEELVVVANHYHVKPLLPLFVNDGQFCVLALGQTSCRLFQCTRFGIEEVDGALIQEKLSKALTSRDSGSRNPPQTGSEEPLEPRQSARSIHDSLRAGDKAELLFHLRLVDEGLRETLPDPRPPIMLAAAEHLISLFKQVSACPEIMEEAIQVGPNLVEPEALHARAMAVIDRRDSRALGAWTGRYLQSSSAGTASADLREVVAGASNGRVDALFVAVGVQCWGTFDSATSSVTLHERREAGDEDLLNLSAVLTAVSGGTVFAVPPADVPGGSSMAAIFRY